MAVAVGEVQRARLGGVGEPAQGGAQAEPGDRRPGQLGDGAVRAALHGSDRIEPDHPVLAAAAQQAPAGRDAGQATGHGPDTGQLEGDVMVDRRHEAGGQGDGLVLRPAAIGELGRALRGVERAGLPLEVVEVGEQVLLPRHVQTLPRRVRRAVERPLTGPSNKR